MSDEKKGFGWGKGCLGIIGVLVGLMVLGAIVGPGGKGKNEAVNVGEKAIQSDGKVDTASATGGVVQDDEGGNLTGPQNNARRTAQQYLSMSGFSRAGLISQLSSDAGDGYSIKDATAAVDSMDVDWKENAAKSAKQYLDMTGFSCKGLIEQLSSSSGDKYTVSQATYGAHQAGACS